MSSIIWVFGASSALLYGTMAYIMLTANADGSPLYTLDVDLSWTVENAAERLGAMGVEGRRAYARFNLVDLLFPIAGFGPLLYLLLSRAYPASSVWVFGVLAAVLDVLENAVIYCLLSATRAVDLGFASSAAEAFEPSVYNLWAHGHWCSILKFLCLGLAIGALVLNWCVWTSKVLKTH